jgi:hypothetical protein
MSNSRIHFSTIQPEALSARVVRGLVLDKRVELDGLAYVDLRGSLHEGLARDLIAALDEHTSPENVGSGGTLCAYRRPLKVFLAFVMREELRLDTRLADLDFEFFVRFRTHLRIEQASNKATTRRRCFGAILCLVTAAARINLYPVSRVRPSNFQPTLDGETTQPYSMEESIELEYAARQGVDLVRRKIQEGKRLLMEGSDPRGHSSERSPDGRKLKIPKEARRWCQLCNLIWYAVFVLKGVPSSYMGKKDSNHSSFNNSTKTSLVGQGCGISKDEVFSHLYPCREELIPFIILLQKATGRNECSVFTLRRDCLKDLGAGKYKLQFRKLRSSPRLYLMNISADGQYSPVALIKTLLEITEPCIAHCDEKDRDNLLIGFSLRAKSGTFQSPDECYTKYQMNRIGGWTQRQGLKDCNGERLRISSHRLRTTYLTKRYLKHGVLSRVSRDAKHESSRTTLGYLDNDATKHIHEAAVADGIADARAVANIVVLSDNDPISAAKSLGVSIQSAKNILSGEQDLFFNACKDINNRPGGPANTPCTAAFQCLECGNCAITSHVMPRIIAFKRYAVGERETLSSEAWKEKFGKVVTIIDRHIVPKFSKETLAEAERSADSEKLYIPLIWK